MKYNFEFQVQKRKSTTENVYFGSLDIVAFSLKKDEIKSFY